jgi:hypothetical protein
MAMRKPKRKKSYTLFQALCKSRPWVIIACLSQSLCIHGYKALLSMGRHLHHTYTIAMLTSEIGSLGRPEL